MIGSFSASDLRVVARLLARSGFDIAEACREVGLDPALIEVPRARFPFSRVARLWGRAVELTGNPHAGLEAAELYRVTDFHGLAVVLLASQNLRTALERFVRYHTVVNTALTMRLDDHGKHLQLSCPTMDLGAVNVRVIEDTRAAILIDVFRSGASGALDPLEVAFSYPQPLDTSAHERIFGCPLKFGAPQWHMSFRAADADAPFLASDRELARNNDQVLARMVAGLRRDDLVARVKVAIIDALPSGAPTDERIAGDLSMSLRSLQRGLTEQKTSFTKLLAVVRLELATHYVEDPEYPVTEISYMLGFSDLSSFSRAFKRWTGLSPVAARRQLLSR